MKASNQKLPMKVWKATTSVFSYSPLHWNVPHLYPIPWHWHLLKVKKKKKIIDEENYVHEKHQDSPTKTKTYLRCQLFYTGCKARIHTVYNCGESFSAFHAVSHTHPASCAKVEAQRAVNSICDSVLAGCATSTRKLIAGATQPQHEESRSPLQTLSMLSREYSKLRWNFLGWKFPWVKFS